MQRGDPLPALVVEDGVFANLVLSFWNWPELRPTFVVKLGKLCGRPATELRQHF